MSEAGGGSCLGEDKEEERVQAGGEGEEGDGVGGDGEGEGEVAAPSGGGGEGTVALSKNQQKKLAKAARIKEKRVKEKEDKKEKKRKAREEREAAGGDEGGLPKPLIEGERRTDNRKRQKTKEEFDELMARGQRVCIDLQWDDVMIDKEVTSLVVQISHLYGMNRRSTDPLNLFLTSVEKRAKAGLEKISGFDAWRITSTDKPYTETFDKSQIVYLCAESPNLLHELDPEKVYIIGGMVDHNRHKNRCHASANEAGVATARLPIDGNVDLRGTRAVLTVNHVFELLLRKSERLGEWSDVLEAVLPTRKTLGRKLKPGKGGRSEGGVKVGGEGKEKREEGGGGGGEVEEEGGGERAEDGEVLPNFIEEEERKGEGGAGEVGGGGGEFVA